MPAPFVRLGRVVRAHGLEGEVSIALRGQCSPSALAGLETWIVPPPPTGAIAHRVIESRPGPKGVVVRLSGLESPDAAKSIAGRWLLARAQDVPDSCPDEDDFGGYHVVDEARGALGSVAEVIVTGANDVLVIEGGSFGQVLVPVIDDVVLDVDRDERTLHVRLLPGLLDEELT